MPAKTKRRSPRRSPKTPSKADGLAHATLPRVDWVAIVKACGHSPDHQVRGCLRSIAEACGKQESGLITVFHDSVGWSRLLSAMLTIVPVGVLRGDIGADLTRQIEKTSR